MGSAVVVAKAATRTGMVFASNSAGGSWIRRRARSIPWLYFSRWAGLQKSGSRRIRAGSQNSLPQRTHRIIPSPFHPNRVSPLRPRLPS